MDGQMSERTVTVRGVRASGLERQKPCSQGISGWFCESSVIGLLVEQERGRSACLCPGAQWGGAPRNGRSTECWSRSGRAERPSGVGGWGLGLKVSGSHGNLLVHILTVPENTCIPSRGARLSNKLKNFFLIRKEMHIKFRKY